MIEFEGITFVNIDGKNIVIKGIGKMFYQEGFPINMAITYLREKGIEVSIFHIADELSKHGWSNETILRKLRFDLEDTIVGDQKYTNFDELKIFVYASYEVQREMIFEYLFGCSISDVHNSINLNPMQWLKNKYDNKN
jgi:hypothetical protein